MILKRKKRGKPTPDDTSKSPHSLRVMSYNIHQGLTASRRQIGLNILKDAIVALSADVVILQEVAGTTSTPQKPTSTGSGLAYQLEILADTLWPYHAYQRNSVFTGGYHGNAILSRFPLKKWNVINISVPGLARRGVLHGEIEVPWMKSPLHLFGTHLGLLQYERHRQIKKLCAYMKDKVPSGPMLLAGDFNDWRERISDKLEVDLKMKEAFLSHQMKHARTFPAGMPVLRLDRIYYRGFKLKGAERLKGRPWSHLSDHLPILAHLAYDGDNK